MPSAGRTSMPSRVAAPLILAVCVTLRLFGSIVTIDLPSTRPMMEAACAEEATKEVVTAPASRIVLKVLNMGVAPVERLSPTEPAWFRSDREQLRGQGRDGCIALEVFATAHGVVMLSPGCLVTRIARLRATEIF